MTSFSQALALSALHIIVWKFVVIAFTRVDTAGEHFKPDHIWKAAISRFRVRLLACSEGLLRWAGHYADKCVSNSIPPGVKDRYGKMLEPLGTPSDQGGVQWDPALTTLYETLGTTRTQPSPHVGLPRSRLS